MVPSPSRNAIDFYIGRRADDATLISRLVRSSYPRWIYDLDEPEEAEAVLLEGCEHAEDLTASVKSSGLPSSDRRRSARPRAFIDKFINVARPAFMVGKAGSNLCSQGFTIVCWYRSTFRNRRKNIHRVTGDDLAHIPATP